MSNPVSSPVKGLRGVVAGQTSLSEVYANEGRLIYRGYDIHDLVKNSTFEEVAYLLWNGELPTQSQLDALKQQMSGERVLPPLVMGCLEELAVRRCADGRAAHQHLDAWPYRPATDSHARASDFRNGQGGYHPGRFSSRTPGAVAAGATRRPEPYWQLHLYVDRQRTDRRGSPLFWVRISFCWPTTVSMPRPLPHAL